MGTNDKDAAARTLIGFVRNYTDMLEKQLTACRETLREAVDGIMTDIQAISQRTAEKKEQANKLLVSTYTSPDAESRHAMATAQAEVNRVFEEAQGAPGWGSANADDGGVKRQAGLFSKHMEALETLDSELSQHLMSMMGLLSRDDVIAQRLDHVVSALQALQTSLSYVLVDFDNRARNGDVDRFVKDLKSYVLRTFTMEEERHVYFEAFPEEKKKAS